jgi:hypothetical protein
MAPVAAEVVAAILLRSRGVFCAVKRSKKGRFPRGSMVMRRGIRVVMKKLGDSLESCRKTTIST